MIEDWIQCWQSEGDEAAAEALYDHFRLKLFRLAFGLLGDADEAEDVMQETLKYALENISRFNPSRGQFGTWLHTIAVNRARDKRRRNSTYRNMLARFGLNDKQEHHLSAEKIVSNRQQSDLLLEMVQTLPLEQREVVWLRYWAGHSFPEISRIVGKPEGTVKSRLRLAHQQLCKIVKIHPIDAGGF